MDCIGRKVDFATGKVSLVYQLDNTYDDWQIRKTLVDVGNTIDIPLSDEERDAYMGMESKLQELVKKMREMERSIGKHEVGIAERYAKTILGDQP